MVLICETLSLLQLGSFMPSLLEIGPGVLERKILLDFINVFLLFRYYLFLEKGVAPHLYKHESTSQKDALCQVWLKLARQFCRRFLTFVNVFSLFHNYLLLEKSMALQLNKLGTPSSKG